MEYISKNNSMLIDNCSLNVWYDKFLLLSRIRYNPLYEHIPPKEAFKQKKDKEIIDQIRKKSQEIRSLYEELRYKLWKSLSEKEKTTIF